MWYGDRLFVEGVLWIARVGEPQRTQFFSAEQREGNEPQREL
jgi:hypothetical protein